MSEELKPCPFCGGEAEIIEVKDNPPETIAIQCKSGCGVSVHNKWMEENVLIERWNTRAKRTCQYDHIEGTWYKTSCGERYDGVVPPNYCPNCGAKVV